VQCVAECVVVLGCVAVCVVVFCTVKYALQGVLWGFTLQNTKTHPATQQNTTTHSERTAPHCNTLQHTATHCNTLQHTATHCNTKWIETPQHTLHRTAPHCTALHHTALHCNTLQHLSSALPIVGNAGAVPYHPFDILLWMCVCMYVCGGR